MIHSKTRLPGRLLSILLAAALAAGLVTVGSLTGSAAPGVLTDGGVLSVEINAAVTFIVPETIWLKQVNNSGAMRAVEAYSNIGNSGADKYGRVAFDYSGGDADLLSVSADTFSAANRDGGAVGGNTVSYDVADGVDIDATLAAEQSRLVEWVATFTIGGDPALYTMKAYSVIWAPSYKAAGGIAGCDLGSGTTTRRISANLAMVGFQTISRGNYSGGSGAGGTFAARRPVDRLRNDWINAANSYTSDQHGHENSFFTETSNGTTLEHSIGVAVQTAMTSGQGNNDNKTDAFGSITVDASRFPNFNIPGFYAGFAITNWNGMTETSNDNRYNNPNANGVQYYTQWRSNTNNTGWSGWTTKDLPRANGAGRGRHWDAAFVRGTGLSFPVTSGITTQVYHFYTQGQTNNNAGLKNNQTITITVNCTDKTTLRASVAGAYTRLPDQLYDSTGLSDFYEDLKDAAGRLGRPWETDDSNVILIKPNLAGGKAYASFLDILTGDDIGSGLVGYESGGAMYYRPYAAADFIPGADVTCTVPAIPGYTFEGWYYKDGDDMVGTADLEIDAADDTREIAGSWGIWYLYYEPIRTYRITYEPGTGTGAAFNDDLSRGSDTIRGASNCGFTTANYTFAGWKAGAADVTPGADIKSLVNIPGLWAGKDSDIWTLTLTAQWTGNPYTVTYDANGGTGGCADTNGGQYGQAYRVFGDTAAGVSREEYYFDSWNTDPDGEGTAYAAGQSVTDDALAGLTLYAQWTEIPPVLYTVTVTGGTAEPEEAAENAIVTVTADTAPTGKVFDKWTSEDGVVFADEEEETTSFTMPAQDVSIKATWKNAPPPKYQLTVADGSGSGEYEAGEVVAITAKPAPSGKLFDKWTATAGALANAAGAATTFTMPAGAATVTATYKDAPPPVYTLTVAGGSGSGTYTEGRAVAITAGAAPAGTVFDGWTATAGSLANAAAAKTIFTMPAEDAAVTANYRELPPKPADKTGLSNRLDAIGGTQQGNFNGATWAAYQSALHAAQLVLADADATQAQIDDALAALNGAFANLTLKPIPPTGTITRNNEFFWRRVVNLLTLTFVFRDYQKVTITASAGAAVEYYVGPKNANLAGAAWTAYSGPFYIHPGWFFRLIGTKTVYARLSDGENPPVVISL